MINVDSKIHALILYCDVRPLEDKELFLKLYRTVSSERRADIDKKKQSADKCLSLGGGILLNELLKKVGITGEIVHGEDGKPYVLDHPEVFVSLTHSYPYAAAVLSDSPCGIDIESKARDLRKIANRFYLPVELESAKDDSGCLTKIWSEKECLIKAFGFKDLIEYNTCSLPEGYRFFSIPLDRYSFEVLLKDGPYRYEAIDLIQCS